MIVHFYIGQVAGTLETCHQARRDARAQHISTDGRSGLGDLGKGLYRVDTFPEATKDSRGENYVTGNLVIPLISDLRNGLEKAADRYSQPLYMADNA